jgi:hypothetical protein
VKSGRLFMSRGYPDDLLDRLGLVEDAEHVIGNVGAGHLPAAADVLPERGPVRAGQRPAGG